MLSNINPISFINTKKNGIKHTKKEIEFFIDALMSKTIDEYQISAWLMAAYLNGLDIDETSWLTEAMSNSGKKIDITTTDGMVVDKHSTGGVGDKTTLVVLPMLASCGAKVIKMSGRGLGITGGTTDKLSSIPNFKLDLTAEQIQKQLDEIGIALTGLSEEVAPADKILYHLRDTTGTVDAIPLITASILSKKIATGAKHILIDVKCGSGAFTQNIQEANKLSTLLIEVGKRCNVNVFTTITDMNQPLGMACGNALEIVEAIEALSSYKPTRFMNLCIELASQTLLKSNIYSNILDAKKDIIKKLNNQEILSKAKEWLCAQGAPADLFTNPYQYVQKANHIENVVYQGKKTWIEKIPSSIIGQSIVDLGGGRTHKDDKIDHSVGVKVFIEIGQLIHHNDILFQIHSKSQRDAIAIKEILLKSIKFSSDKIEPIPIVLKAA